MNYSVKVTQGDAKSNFNEFLTKTPGKGRIKIKRKQIKNCESSCWKNFCKIVVPMLYPYAFATLRISFGVSWKVVLTAELFGGSGGMGYMLNKARQEFETEIIFALITFMIIFVIASELLVFQRIQKILDKRYHVE